MDGQVVDWNMRIDGSPDRWSRHFVKVSSVSRCTVTCADICASETEHPGTVQILLSLNAITFVLHFPTEMHQVRFRRLVA